MTLENSVLSSLSNAEHHNGLCRNLDGFTRCWVAANASWALYLYQLADTWENEFAVLLNLAQSHVYEGFDEHGRVLLAEAGLGSEFGHDLGFGHFSHSGIGQPDVMSKKKSGL